VREGKPCASVTEIRPRVSENPRMRKVHARRFEIPVRIGVVSTSSRKEILGGDSLRVVGLHSAAAADTPQRGSCGSSPTRAQARVRRAPGPVLARAAGNVIAALRTPTTTQMSTLSRDILEWREQQWIASTALLRGCRRDESGSVLAGRDQRALTRSSRRAKIMRRGAEMRRCWMGGEKKEKKGVQWDARCRHPGDGGARRLPLLQ